MFRYISQMDRVKLNRKQALAMEAISNGESVCLTGVAGTGKSTIIKQFKADVNDPNVAITAMTGIAAIILSGTTLHSYLGIGLGQASAEVLIDRIVKKPYMRRRWRKLKTLIIDEVSMLSPFLFDKLEEIARGVRENDLPFGGIQIVACGDFCQLPCVERNKGPDSTEDKESIPEFCFEAKSWPLCITRTIYLTEIIRQSDIEFQNCLNEVRLGKLSQESKDLLKSRVNLDLTNELGIKPTKIYTTNADVDEINERELDLLARDGAEFLQYDMVVNYYVTGLQKQFLQERLRKLCLAADVLQLCVGAQIMLIYNIDLDSQLVNGSRGIVTGFEEGLPVVQFLNGKKRIIDYNTWEIKENDKTVMTITQIPLKLGYAFTTHKSQGSTLDYAEVDLGNIFEYGQAYVALSRVKTLSGLSITNLAFERINCHPKSVAFYKNLE
jgi:ATP-dependent DNA helicase PIF1